MARTGDDDDLVVEERSLHGALAEPCTARPDREVDPSCREQRLELARVMHAQLDVEVVRAAGEQLDEPRRCVLGEQARRRDPHQAPSASRLAYFADRSVLQAEHLDRTTCES